MEEGQLEQTEKRVAPLELFFDLVFVFAVTQVTVLMSHHPTWEGLGQGLLVLAALWWCWGAYAWLTNYIAADEGLERLLMFVVMGALLIAALAVPHAFDEDALLFGLAYAMAVRLQGIGIPPQFVSMLPYLLTIAVLVLLARRLRNRPVTP